MQRVSVQKAKARRPRTYEPLPLDPRDPDIVRVKALARKEENRWTSIAATPHS